MKLHMLTDMPRLFRFWRLNTVRMILVVVTSTLAGCGNFIENIDIGEWVEDTDVPNIVIKPRDDVTLSVIKPGEGAYIQEGDLVQLRITVSKKLKNNTTETLPARTIWLWTGGGSNYVHWLGDKFFRASLIGKRVGASLALSPRGDAQLGGIVSVPLYGFELPHTEFESLEISNRSSWANNAFVTSNIEVLNTCKGTLYSRKTTITQWGLIIGMYAPPTSRSGYLFWNGLSGTCTSPNEQIWLMTTPVNTWNHNLNNAYSTFESLHPKSKYPEDYWRPSLGVPAIPPKLKEQALSPQAKLAREIEDASRPLPPSKPELLLKDPPAEKVMCAEAWDVQQLDVNTRWAKAALAKNLPEDSRDLLETRVWLEALGYSRESQIISNVVERRGLLQMLGKPLPKAQSLDEEIRQESSQAVSLAELRARALSQAVQITVPVREFDDVLTDSSKAAPTDFPVEGGLWTSRLSANGSFISLPVQIEQFGKGWVVAQILADIQLIPVGKEGDSISFRLDTDNVSKVLNEKSWVRAYTAREQTKTFSTNPNKFDHNGNAIKPWYDALLHDAGTGTYWIRTELTISQINEMLRGLKEKSYRLEIKVLDLKMSSSSAPEKPSVKLTTDGLRWPDHLFRNTFSFDGRCFPKKDKQLTAGSFGG